VGLATGVKGKARLKLIQLHRLLEFETAFSAYLEGKVTPAYVLVRAKKMLNIGLPRLK
jgi:hypothetical protein